MYEMLRSGCVSNISDNLSYLMDLKNISAYDIQRAKGIPQPSIYRIAKGITANPKLETISAIADYFNISTESLLHDNLRLKKEVPEIDNDKDYVLIPVYDAIAACGLTGHLNDHPQDIMTGFPFPQKWLDSLGVKRTAAACIQAEGDSMLPTINEGAMVMIDLGNTEGKEGKVFVICRNGRAIIKRLQINQDEDWVYCSDNTNKILYPDLHPLENDFIIGRVVWQGGSQGL